MSDFVSTLDCTLAPIYQATKAQTDRDYVPRYHLRYLEYLEQREKEERRGFVTLCGYDAEPDCA